ncbi:MAG: hypothetical protein HW421_1597 [Ignavibacteria bacterium]|nr:hypothetical protein [Ignavibacteria bacterium]
MKEYKWNIEKNIKLKFERNITFEDIVFYINNGNLLEIIENPNNEMYSGQRVYILNIKNYIYYVPFNENEKEIFLITIIPSRKLTRKYLGEI